MKDTKQRTTRPERGEPRPPPRGAIAPGTRIRDYEVLDVLSAGGFGTVYEVEHMVLERRGALKVLHAELAASREAVLRFEREARAANLIQHPNVADVYDFGELEDGRPYFVMEFLEGVDLSSHLRSRGRLPPHEALAILEPVCEALTTAHERHIIHRDIKPSNVFLAGPPERRRVVLLDFGVAKLVDPGETDLTTSRHAVGTPACMAPEQIKGAPVDARTDVYGLGGLAFHMLTGQPAFAHESATIVQHMHIHARRPRPSSMGGVPAGLDEVIACAMSVDPDDRYPSAGAFVRALRDVLASTREPARTTRAVAVHVDIRVDAEALEDPDDALLTDMESIVPLAARSLSALGFCSVLEAGNAALYLLPLAGEPAADRASRAAALEAALRLRRALAARPARHPAVRVNLCLHVDQVLLAGTKVHGGPLIRLSAWVPDADLDGVGATPAVVEGLDALGDGRAAEITLLG